MKLTARIQECQDCQTLKNLLVQVDCSLQNLLKNKVNSEDYNVSLYYCSGHSKTLSHYKRILTKRIFNPTYLCEILSQDIVTQIRKILFGTCANCIKCDEIDNTTTTVIDVTTTSMIPPTPETCVCKGYSIYNPSIESTDSKNVTYVDCNAQVQSFELPSGDTQEICACSGTIVSDGNLIIIEMGDCPN